jgi:NTP pyrophosphatase (non-canonical NTP hydrolase)
MLNDLARDIHENAVNHGWWESERSFGGIIALCHSELSEALEEYRNGKPMFYYMIEEHNAKIMQTDIANYNGEKIEGISVELADCIIRILDYCGKENIDIENIIKMKHEYNKTRPYKHGGKKI